MKVMTSLFFIILLHTFGNSIKVAIIGKGFGAAICSYYLRQMIPKIEIDIYDHKPKCKHMFRTYIHSKNIYMNEIIQKNKFVTKIMDNDNRPMIKVGDQIYIYDVKELTADSDPTDYLKVKEFVQQQLKNFEQIYQFQAEGKSFKTTQELLNSLSPEFEKYYTNKTTSLFLEENIPSSIRPGITKFVKSGLFATCFADINSHGFVGLEILMSSDITGDVIILMEDQGTILKKLYKKRQNFIQKDILKIIHSNDDNMNYIVSNDNRQNDYDFVILATVTAAQIKFERFAKPIKIFQYVEGKNTYILGTMLDPFKELPCKSNTIINLDLNHIFTKNDIMKVYAVSKKSMEAWQSEISEYVNPYVIKSLGTFDSCPDYSKDKSVRNVKFELEENLYNVYASDCLVLSNEMVAISGKNIALLIKEKISKNIMPPKIIEPTKIVDPTKKSPKTKKTCRKKKQVRKG